METDSGLMKDLRKHPRKVSTLKHAVALLGVKRFAQIAVSSCMSKTMDKAVEGYGLSPGALDRLGIKLEQYEVFAEKTQSLMKELSDTLIFD
ncbi:hypothetical protein ACFL2S_12775 [Thermodesulfobacteriota bacterium]